MSDLLNAPRYEAVAHLAQPLADRFSCVIHVRLMRKLVGDFPVAKLVEVLGQQVEATIAKRRDAGATHQLSRYPLVLQGDEVALSRAGGFLLDRDKSLAWLGVVIVAGDSEVWLFIDEAGEARAMFEKLVEADTQSRRRDDPRTASRFKKRRPKPR